MVDDDGAIPLDDNIVAFPVREGDTCSECSTVVIRNNFQQKLVVDCPKIDRDLYIEGMPKPDIPCPMIDRLSDATSEL